jgi:hypothetical protein
MPTTQPRVNVVLEKPLYDALAGLAEHEGVSLSHKARDLILHAVTLEEDAALEALVLHRKKNRAASISLDQVKKRLRVR